MEWGSLYRGSLHPVRKGPCSQLFCQDELQLETDPGAPASQPRVVKSEPHHKHIRRYHRPWKEAVGGKTKLHVWIPSHGCSSMACSPSGSVSTQPRIFSNSCFKFIFKKKTVCISPFHVTFYPLFFSASKKKKKKLLTLDMDQGRKRTLAPSNHLRSMCTDRQTCSHPRKKEEVWKMTIIFKPALGISCF